MIARRARAGSRAGLEGRELSKRALVGALIGALASLIPWPEILWDSFGFLFVDRENYIYKIEYQQSQLYRFYYYYEGVLDYFTDEFLWALIMDASLRSNFLYYETLFQLITTLSISGLAAILARRMSYFALILIINPLVIDFVYSQLRLALALSLLIWLVVFRVRAWYFLIPVALVATMIHTSMLIFICAHFLATWTGSDGVWREWSVNKRTIVLVVFGICIGVLVGPLREIVLSSVGDRRADYQDAGSSFLYLSYWIILFLSLIADRVRTLQSYESRYALAILGIIFINLFSGFYSLRFIAAIFPFLICASLRVFGQKNFIISIPFLIYFVFQWLYYIGNLTR